MNELGPNLYYEILLIIGLKPYLLKADLLRYS